MTKDMIFGASQSGLTAALKAVGVKSNSVVFLQADIRRIGRLDALTDRILLLQAYFNAFLTILGTGNACCHVRHRCCLRHPW